MTITAAMVKDLREKTGAGMMDCKKALNENNGDFEAAVDWLRTKGIAKAEKKASRVAAEGMVMAVSEGNKGAMIEVNSETDFVAKNEKFQEFVKELANMVLSSGEADVEKLKAMTYKGGKNVADSLTDLVATIGENMNIRRAEYVEVPAGNVGAYIHMGGKIGVLTAVEAGSSSDKLAEVSRQVAMHVAAVSPKALNRDSMDADLVEREKTVMIERAKESGKPEAIVEKIVMGQINKFFEENCLVDQAFVMDTDRKVGKVIADADSSAKITSYVRFGLGDGIEKEQGDFAAEVAAAVNG